MALNAVHLKVKFAVGDIIRVKQQFYSGGKAQSQFFEGIVMGIKGRGDQKSFTVRKIGADGIGVEKIFPLASPNLLKLSVKKPGRVRRGKLYYLRSRTGKEALATKSA